MAEFIDREELLKYREEMWKDRCDYMVVRVTNIIHLPKKYVVSVVRCKDCKHCEKEYPVCNGIDEPQPKYLCKVADTYMNPDDYCSYGERKADNG